MRTEEDLTNRTVSHAADNIDHDNRKSLLISPLKTKVVPDGWEA